MTAPATEKSAKSGPAPWIRIVVGVPVERVEETAVFLAEITGAGTETVAAPGAVEQGLAGLAAYFPAVESESRERAILERLEAEAGAEGPAPRLLSREVLPAEEWGRTWKEHFHRTRVSRRLAVRPPWEEDVSEPGTRVMVIDPGMAFGTGLHASTRLALGMIDDLYRTSGNAPLFSVLDVGTGTGILAMACGLLGARLVRAVDNDPDAVEAARKNVEANGLMGIVEVGAESLDAVSGPFDLICANIVHDTLVGMAPLFAARLAPGGRLVCSGILAGEQEENLRGALREEGCRHLESRHEGEWVAQLFFLDKLP